MADKNSVFAKVGVLACTLILFSTLGAFAFDIATAGVPAVRQATAGLAQSALIKYVLLIKTVEVK